MTASACDVLVVGAGPAGCATALALAGDCRVRLVDRTLVRPFSVGESATPDVSGLLRQLGMEDRFDWREHRPYQGNLSLWGGDDPQRDPFMFRSAGHGWHLDRAAFDRQLRDEVRKRGIAIHERASVEQVLPARDGWDVRIHGLGDVRARVIVDAGGRRAPLVARLGVRRQRLDRLVALATHATECDDLAGFSLVESCADGWWYAVRLPDGRALVTMMTDRDIAQARGLHAFESYRRAWRNTRLLAKHVPVPAEPFPVHAFAAHGGCIERAAGPGWIVVGDALMALDPLASSGIAGALSDGLSAAPAIMEMLEGRASAARDFGRRANAAFQRYLQERLRHYSEERHWADDVFWSRRRV